MWRGPPTESTKTPRIASFKHIPPSFENCFPNNNYQHLPQRKWASCSAADHQLYAAITRRVEAALHALEEEVNESRLHAACQVFFFFFFIGVEMAFLTLTGGGSQRYLDAALGSPPPV